MSYLLDTNVVSELRKRDRCNHRVAAWYTQIEDAEVFLSVLTVGEIRRGIENIRRRDHDSAASLETWLSALIAHHAHRILPVTEAVANEWGRVSSPDPLPVIDALLAATAKLHGLTFVSRNVVDVRNTGVRLLNPFEEVSPPRRSG